MIGVWRVLLEWECGAHRLNCGGDVVANSGPAAVAFLVDRFKVPLRKLCKTETELLQPLDDGADQPAA